MLLLLDVQEGDIFTWTHKNRSEPIWRRNLKVVMIRTKARFTRLNPLYFHCPAWQPEVINGPLSIPFDDGWHIGPRWSAPRDMGLIQNSHQLLFSRSFPAQLQRWFGKCLQMSPAQAERHHVSSPTWNVSGLESRAGKRRAYFPCQLTWRKAPWGPWRRERLLRRELALIPLFGWCWKTQIGPEFKEILPKYQINFILLLILQLCGWICLELTKQEE